MSEPIETPIEHYWRSLARLEDSPAAQALPEFPDGADLPPDELSRRTFLELMAASMAMAGLAGCRRPVEHIVPFVEPPADRVPGVAQRYATTMPLGTSACGVLVTSHDGRPTKIEGNPLHPASGGAAGLLQQAALLELYDPDRSRGVRHRGDPAPFEAFLEWWRQRAEELAAAGGRGLAVLADPFASPTLARFAAELRGRYPEMRWVAWAPVADDQVFTGHGGRRPVYHLEQARVVVAADADLLLTESESLRHARGWAQGRRPEADEMLRLYAVESSLSITGGNADHRIPLPSRLVPAFLAALARELGVAAEAPGEEGAGALPESARQRLPLIARDLAAAGSAGLVVAGRRQPPAAHATALAINQRLGAVGRTVTLHSLEDVAWGSEAELAELTTAMHGGEVETLVVLGGNPVYDAPVDLRFAAALERVAHRVHLSLYRDETSRRCHWHLPEAHWLEAWGDARSADGTASVAQPLIAPLHGGMSRVELLGLLATGDLRPGYEGVRETWGALAADEDAWRRLLHDGVLSAEAAGAGPAGTLLAARSVPPLPAAAETPGAATAPGAAAPPEAEASLAAEPGAREAAPASAPATAALSPSLAGYELVFHASPRFLDGRFANNPWLHELPDPVTKLVWDNAALLSPATARELGVADGDRLLLVNRGHRLVLPVLVAPGQADGSIAVELGHGREAAGRVGNGVGRNAYRLRTSDAPWVASGVVARPTRGRVELVRTQEHWSLEGRNLVREATLEQFRADPGFARRPEAGLRLASLWPEPAYEHGPQWGMVIDLSSCIGCSACVVACQSENNIPVVGKEQVGRGREMHWLRVDRYFSGTPEDPRVAFQPVPCMHCENAPCEQVCPVAATVHDDQGLNLMVYNRCIGTRYCSNNCPYKVRRFNFFNYTKDTPELLAMAANPEVTVRSRGVMEKCSYCVQRIHQGRAEAKRAARPLADGEVQTACQQTCPTRAITFGDLRDPDSAVARAKQGPLDYVLLAELNNKPRTSYQARLRNPHPEWA